MKNKYITILICLLFSGILSISRLHAQSTAEIQNVDFNVINDTMVINYDLVYHNFNQLFSITLVIKTVSGKTIFPQSVSGDVVDNVLPGKNKKIYWTILNDNITLDEEIFVEIMASPMQKKAVVEYTSELERKHVSKGGAIVLSAFFPGAGITRLRGGGAYGLLLIPFYAAAGGAVATNIIANTNYDDYKKATTSADRDKYYKDANDMGDISNNLFIVATAIWVGNMIWTIATPNKTKNSSNKLSFSGTIDPVLKQPMVGLQFNF